MLLSKFFVVMLNAIFESIMRFHKRYNTKEMYRADRDDSFKYISLVLYRL
jgi:hypothetical protein